MNTGTKVTTGATATTHDINIHTAIMDVITDVWDRAKQINEATYEVLDLIEPYAKRIAELEAARIAYASEFAPDEDGNPDVGSIHENIRKLKAELKKSVRNGGDKENENDHLQHREEPEPCFCDRMYPDSNPDVSCGDCPTRDYKEPMKDSVDIDDFIAAFIARGDITKEAFWKHVNGCVTRITTPPRW